MWPDKHAIKERALLTKALQRVAILKIVFSNRFPDLLKVETVPDDPESTPRKRAIRLPKPANDNGKASQLQAKVLIPKDFPITQIEIEVFALLLDDLRALAANDNEEAPK